MIGPLLACGVADAYGAGFEYADRGSGKGNSLTPKEYHNRNDLSRYWPHPKWGTDPGDGSYIPVKPGSYTDDTQMALGLAEHMLCSGKLWNHLVLATRWVETFHRDVRSGYAGGFYNFLTQTKTGEAFLAGIQPHSDKSGGAMRAFPVGLLADTAQVRDLAMLQASVTHATIGGMSAAAAAALMFHHRYHRLGPKSDLPDFLDRWVLGVGFSQPWQGRVGGRGLDIVRAALWAYMETDSLADAIQRAVAFTGDVDTVAAIAAPAAAVCNETDNYVPDALINGLENGTYGKDHLIQVDEDLRKAFPPRWSRATKPAPKPAPKPDPKPPEKGPLDFLFEDDD